MLRSSITNSIKPLLTKPTASYLTTRIMSTTTTPKIFAEGGETNHGLELNPIQNQIVQDVMALFCSKPTHEIFTRSWNVEATFEDPIAIAKGFKEYSAQWWGMPKAFPQSETLAWKVTKLEGNIIEYEQRQKYTVAVINKVKVMSSLVHLELDSDNKIIKMEDRWDGNALPSGMIAKHFRGLNGKVMPWMIGVPKV